MDRAHDLSDWLHQLHLIYPAAIFIKDSLEEFRDGFALCKIVEVLEHKVLEGLSKNPKTTASCLHNVNKVLETLRKNKVLVSTCKRLTYL
jgi:hypothetical protein